MRWGSPRDERGQALVFITIAAVVLMGMTGLAIDVGRMFATHAQLQRASDAAALSGVQALPNVSQAVSDAVQYVAINEPGASATANQVGSEPKLKVTSSKSVNMMFAKVLGVNTVTVQASATAGFTGTLDVGIVLDTTGSMDGQPLTDAKAAATDLVNMLLPDASNQTRLALAPFRSCYSPNNAPYNSCVPSSQVISPTTNANTIKSGISSMSASGVTNVCMGLWKASSFAWGTPGPNTHRYIVLLSDGDNNPHFRSQSGWPSACDAGGNNSEGQNDSVGWGLACGNDQGPERTLDTKTLQMADSLKAAGFEIFVVGKGVCGSSSTTLCNRNQVGSSGSDNSRDRNLLKCIASSKSGTNDHYIETGSSAEFVDAFRKIGSMIITRLIE
jgi:Flp pilus assembly protein TadG